MGQEISAGARPRGIAGGVEHLEHSHARRLSAIHRRDGALGAARVGRLAARARQARGVLFPAGSGAAARTSIFDCAGRERRGADCPFPMDQALREDLGLLSRHDGVRGAYRIFSHQPRVSLGRVHAAAERVSHVQPIFRSTCQAGDATDRGHRRCQRGGLACGCQLHWRMAHRPGLEHLRRKSFTRCQGHAMVHSSTARRQRACEPLLRRTLHP